ncbi:hypothetical protein OSB04_002499 [Centaurea solstitialis]|uniref:Uncharacterized protein n=1 Tax=Centaurea solstitialis TaxID=347529 RepID=A0AA38TT01_9ASTR|nr:hypothetical protein OSB04_002499 [Centaurea solstitialis]
MDPNTAQTLLDTYVLDYMKRRGLNRAAACFAIEARIGDQPPAIDGLLSDWWAIFSMPISQEGTTTLPFRMHLSTPPFNVPRQNVMMQDDQNDDLETKIINISNSSDELQTSSEDDPLSRLIPRGIPLTHFLVGFPQQCQSSNPESSTPEKQLFFRLYKGTSKVPVKVFRGDSSQRQTIGQLRLRPKSNKGGDVATDDMSIENDDLVSEDCLSQDEKDVAEGKIQMLTEVVTFFTSNDKVLCCHFSSDGKLLATAGNDKMVSVWNVESLCHLGNTPQQSNMITDVRFKPHSTVFATSSFDTTIRLWDAANVSKLLVELDGHVDQVISVDFNPYEPEIICSCGCNGEIRLWDINKLACISMHKVDGPMRQVRFQLTNLLAVASGNMIVLIDIEINRKECLEGHSREIQWICWDVSGTYLGSVSEDSARVWSTTSGWKCDYEFHLMDNVFQSCTFHPVHSLLLVIGGFKVFSLDYHIS